MLDRYREVLLYGRHELRRSLIERGVDLVGALDAGVGNKEVARDGEDGHSVRGGVEVEDHDDVTVDAVYALAADAVTDVLLLERASVGRADQEDVLGPALLAVRLAGGQPLHRDAVH